jgi:ElaB/YqjD/DUF883 family membrane-anchored ribosome-binding protein
MNINHTADKTTQLTDQLASSMDHAATQANSLAHQGLEAARQGSLQLQARARQASESTVGYIKEEPVKSVLIAAATGAALMGLISLIRRSGN